VPFFFFMGLETNSSATATLFVSEKKAKKTHEFLTLNPVRGFFAGLSAGVPARESAAVDAAADPGNTPAVGDG